MRDPPKDSGRDYTGLTFSMAYPQAINLVAMRTVAQSLHDITMCDLHSGDLSLAHQDLLALVGMAHLHAESWTIVDQMIRSVMAGLAVDAVWMALRAPGWTDGQLAELQDKLASLSFFKEMEQAIRAERAVGLDWYCALKTNRNATAFGILNRGHSMADLPEKALGWLWETLWADGDLWFYCQYQQRFIDLTHELAVSNSYRQIAADFDEFQTDIERAFSGVRRYKYLWSAMHYPNMRRVLETLAKNETSRQLAIAAIAIERCKVRHGKLPSELKELQPEFVSVLPVDLYVGRPLLYRPKVDGEFTLYSVGVNFRDDGGGTNDVVWPKPIWPANSTK